MDNEEIEDAEFEKKFQDAMVGSGSGGGTMKFFSKKSKIRLGTNIEVEITHDFRNKKKQNDEDEDETDEDSNDSDSEGAEEIEKAETDIDKLLERERIELENLALALFERGQLQINHFMPGEKKEFGDSEGFENSQYFFKFGTLAAKLMRTYSKNLGADYLIKILRPPLGTISMKVDEKKITVDAVHDHLSDLEEMCSEVLTNILSSRNVMPESLLYLSRHLYNKIYNFDQDRLLNVMGEFLFVRFICPALLQLGSYNLLPSRYAVSTATKGVLVLISKVLQKFAEMSYFDPIKEPTMALFNDFIYKHSESVQQYFCSFCHVPEKIPFCLHLDREDLDPLLSVLLEKLRVSIQVNSQLKHLFGCLPPHILKQVQILLAQEELDSNELIQLLIDPKMDLVFAICSVSDAGSQTDSVADALMLVFDVNGKAFDLIEWVLDDEMNGNGKTHRKVESHPTTAEGGIRSENLYFAQSGGIRLGSKFSKTKWVILNEKSISVYKSDKDMKKPLTEILFSECTKVERKPKEPKDSPIHTFEISTQKSTFLFGFTNEIKYLDWFNDIKAIITKETIHSISVTGEKVYHKGDIITQNKLIDVSLFNDGDAPEFQYKTRLTVDPKMNDVFKEGEITKQGGQRKNWKKRWFVLEKGYLLYFKNKNEVDPLGEIDLEKCTGIQTPPNRSKRIELILPERTYYLELSNDEDFNDWLNVLQTVLFYFKPSLGSPNF